MMFGDLPVGATFAMGGHGTYPGWRKVSPTHATLIDNGVNDVNLEQDFPVYIDPFVLATERLARD
jgi:hypothetical protein